MAFRSGTRGLLYAADPSTSVSLIGGLARHGRNLIEGIVSWGGRKGTEVKSLGWRIGGAKAKVSAPVVRSSTPVISLTCRTTKPSVLLKNAFSGFFLRSRPESFAAKYAAKITPQPYWSFFRTPEQFRMLGKRLAMYSLVGLSFAANGQGSQDVMDFSEVCHDIQKMFSDRLVYEASCTSVERMVDVKLDGYEFGQPVMISGPTACFEAKIKPILTMPVSWEIVSESCVIETISEQEPDVSFISEDNLMPSDLLNSENGLEQSLEVVCSQQSQQSDIYEVVCGQHKKLSALIHQLSLMPDDNDDSVSDSDSSIEVIDNWQESDNDLCEANSRDYDDRGFDDYDDDESSSSFFPDVARQLDCVTAVVEKHQTKITELLAVVLDQNRRLKASLSKPVNDFNLVIKVRWMTDCSMEYATGVLTSELLPAYECFNVHHDWSRNHRRIPSHFNVAPVIGGFLTTVRELRMLPACHDVLPCLSSWQQDIAVCVVTKKYELTLAEYLASHDPGIPDAMLMWLQLVEAVVHMGHHNMSHRDLKSDNIFIEQLADGPHVLVANFGSSLHMSTKYGLPVACDIDDMRRCSCSYLMAPECTAARSPLLQVFTKADLWACGAIAYELFGAPNPFRHVSNGKRLTSSTYQECELPDLPGAVPSFVNRLVKLMLTRNPNMRPEPELIANVVHLSLWAPHSWRQSLPSRLQIKRWITQFAAETYLLSSPYSVEWRDDTRCGNTSINNALKVQFLWRANPSAVGEAARLLYGLSEQ